MKVKEADFAVIDAPNVNHWLYHFRPNACVATYVGGEKIWDAGTLECVGDLLFLPEKEWAAIRSQEREPVALSKGAGEFLM